VTVIDFFCGGGGFSEGFRQAGFNIIWAVDNWKVAVDTHNENHPEGTAICDDVIRISKLPDEEFHALVPDSNVIIGSPPCTDFSNSNRSGNADKTKGKELILAYLRIVARKMFQEDSMLEYWLLENVPKVQSHIQNQYTMEELELEGDQVLVVKGEHSGVYNAKYFGVPSNRMRYFCGHFPAPVPVINNDEQLIPLRVILTALGEPREWLHAHIIDPIYGLTMRGEDVTDHHYTQMLSEFERTKLTRLKEDKGYMGKMAVPENPDRPARTIMATMSFTSRECFVLGTRDQLRAPTIREVASLMSFPIDYRFYGPSLGTKYRMVGNAVPPKLSYAFARAIAERERLELPTNYTPIVHSHVIGFINLNLDEIAVKQEKPKQPTAKFKYHIPHFKFETYRVELTNRNSDFERLRFRWDAEIHYNQGKEKAKFYTPMLENMGLDKEDMKRADAFLDRIRTTITGFGRFQQIHCMTMKQIRMQRLLGPYEVLHLLKQFLDKEFKFTKKNVDQTLILEEPYLVPRPVAIGYYMLYQFTRSMANDKASVASDQTSHHVRRRATFQAG
jgi:DNA (cytosine-5)-methyltransferase 1